MNDSRQPLKEGHDYAVNFLKEQIKNAGLFKIIILVLMVSIFIAIMLWIFSIFQLQDKNCKRLKKVYKNETAPLSSISNDKIFDNPIYDFYIKTAYNACSSGNFKNSFVDSKNSETPFCALKTCIQQGARCLDFEIYSVNNEPVIATSSIDSFNIKETFNYLKLKDALEFISDNAFTTSVTPVWNDPLFLNFRVMSDRTNNPIYSKMTRDIVNAFNDRLLDSKYNLINSCESIAKLPLSQFKGKVIIIIDKFTYDILKTVCPQLNNCMNGMTITNDNDKNDKNDNNDNNDKVESNKKSLCDSDNLLEVLNMHSGSPFIHTFRVKDVLLSDTNELKYQNKTVMTILLPNYSENAKNFNPTIGFASGCQFVGMSFQNFDNNLEYYSLFFNKAGHSFVLKPKNLRYIKVTIKNPSPYPEKTDLNRKPLIVTDGYGQEVNLINHIGPENYGVDNIFPMPQLPSLKNNNN